MAAKSIDSVPEVSYKEQGKPCPSHEKKDFHSFVVIKPLQQMLEQQDREQKQLERLLEEQKALQKEIEEKQKKVQENRKKIKQLQRMLEDREKKIKKERKKEKEGKKNSKAEEENSIELRALHEGYEEQKPQELEHMFRKKPIELMDICKPRKEQMDIHKPGKEQMDIHKLKVKDKETLGKTFSQKFQHLEEMFKGPKSNLCDDMDTIREVEIQQRTFEVKNYSTEIKNECLSPAMYTHLYGYKFYAKIYVSARSYLCVTLFSMPGEYDYHLQWPAKAKFTIEIVNPVGEENAMYISDTWTWEKPLKESKITTSGLSLLETSKVDGFLANDVLKFCISNIKLQKVF